MRKLSASEGMERTREKSGAQESRLKIRARLQSQQGTVALNRKLTEKSSGGLQVWEERRAAIPRTCVCPGLTPNRLGPGMQGSMSHARPCLSAGWKFRVGVNTLGCRQGLLVFKRPSPSGLRRVTTAESEADSPTLSSGCSHKAFNRLQPHVLSFSQNRLSAPGKPTALPSLKDLYPERSRIFSSEQRIYSGRKSLRGNR